MILPMMFQAALSIAVLLGTWARARYQKNYILRCQAEMIAKRKAAMGAQGETEDTTLSLSDSYYAECVLYTMFLD